MGSNRAGYHRDYYLANQVELRRRANVYYLHNKPRVLALEGRRRALRFGGAAPEVDTSEFDAVVRRYAEAVRLTEATGTPHSVDHIQPLSWGGSHFADNLQILTEAEHLTKTLRDFEFQKETMKRVYEEAK